MKKLTLFLSLFLWALLFPGRASASALPCGCDEYTQIGYDGATTYFTDIVSNPSSGLPAGCYIVYGTFVINVNTFITNSQLIMAGGAEIVIQDAELFTDNTTYEGCIEMWKGFTVKNGAALVSSYIGAAGNTITDAQYGVHALKDSRVRIVNTTFDRNYMPIFLDGDGGDIDVDYWYGIIDNHFLCNGSLLAPYPEQYPHPGNKTRAGIYLKEVHNEVKIGFSQYQVPLINQFEGLRNGIISESSNLIAQHCHISKLIGDSDDYNFPFEKMEGKGFYLKGGKAFLSEFVTSDLAEGVLVYQGDGAVDKSAIKANKNGIRLQKENNRQMAIRDNDITAIRGIIVEDCSGANKIEIEDNVIQLLDMDKSIGIRIVNTGNPPSQSGSLKLEHNKITAASTSATGISIKNSSLWKVKENNVVNYGTPILGTGIFLSSAKNCQIRGNDIDGSGMRYGIRLQDSPELLFCCNSLKNSNTGMRVEGNCNSTKIATTQFHDHHHGLVFGPGAFTGPQGNGLSGFNGNQWNGTTSGWDALHEDPAAAASSVFYVPPVQLPANVSPANWFITSFGLVRDCSNWQDCGEEEWLVAQNPSETKAAPQQDQSTIFTGVLKELEADQKDLLQEQIADFQVFQFPLQEFNQYLKNGTHEKEDLDFQLQIGDDLNWEVHLEENNIWASDGIRATRQDQKLEEKSVARKIHTYKGNINQQDQQWIRWYVSEDKFSGLAIVDGNAYHIDPLQTYIPTAPEGLWVMTVKEYHLEDYLPEGVVKKAKSTTAEPERWLELAAEVDYEFYQDYDSDVSQVEATIDARVNLLNGLYKTAVNVNVELVFLHIWKTSNDPYVGDRNTLYLDLMTYWNKNFPCIRRDVVHLFTGRTGFGVDGAAGSNNGITGKGSICGTRYTALAQYFPTRLEAYAYSWSTNSRDVDSWFTTAHEIGHNFNLGHECNEDLDYIMCGGNSCNCGDITDAFSSNSIDDLITYFNGTKIYPDPPLGEGFGTFNSDVCLVELDPADEAYNDQVAIEMQQMEDVGFNNGITLSGNTYNFGVNDLNTIPNVTINDGGFLRVNNVGNTAYLDGPATTQNDYTAYTSRCGSYITINDGGKMILGNDDGNVHATRRADVHVREFSTIRVKSGGTLRLARGSKLIIEEGAELIIDAGANIDLWWSESTIHVKEKGILRIRGTYDFVGSGFFQFDEGHYLILENDTPFVLHGQGDRFIRLNENAKLDVGENGIDLKSGAVEYEDNTAIIAAGGLIKAYWVNFESLGAYSNYAFDVNKVDNLDFFFCKFNDFFVGIHAADTPESALLRTRFCNFNNCNIGIAAISFPTLDVRVTNFTAGTFGHQAVWAENVDRVTMTGCTVKDFPILPIPVGALKFITINEVNLNGCVLTDNGVGVSLAYVPSFNMRGGSISQNIPTTFAPPVGTVGIYVPEVEYPNNQSNINLYSGATIQSNHKGIWVAQGGQTANGFYGKVLMDCAKLKYNKIGITGQDVPLEIDAIAHCNCTDLTEVNPNTFLHNINFPQGQRLFDICYVDLENVITSVSARGNYWGGGSPTANTDYHFRIGSDKDPCAGFNDLPLFAGLYTDTEPKNCNGGEGDDKPNDDGGEDRAGDLETFQQKLLVYPNPASDQVSLSLEQGTEKATLRILTIDGRVKQNLELQEGQQVHLQTTDWHRGIYIIQLDDGTTRMHRKLIIE